MKALKKLDEERNREREERKVFRNGDLNLDGVRPTDLKQNTRVNPPLDVTHKSEAAILVQQDSIRRCIKDYYQSVREEPILSESEERGRKSIQNRVKNGAIVISFTDKDARIVIGTPEIYREAAMIHISKDEEVDWSELDNVTGLMNRTSKQILRMFDIGNESSKGRIVKGSITKDTNPPPVSFLWKTHKSYDV